MLDMSPKLVPTILHLISSLKIGGAERLLVSTMQAARKFGYPNFVVVVMNDQVDDNLYAELAATGFPVYRLNRPEGHLHPKYLVSLAKIVRKHGVGVIHSHNDGSRIWAMAAKLAVPGLKVVYTVHAQGNAEQITGLNRFAYRHLIDATVSISTFITEEARVLSSKRMVQIDNGIDLSKFLNRDRTYSPRLPLRLMQVSRITPVKGQDILIDAVKRCRDNGLNISCTFVGVVADKGYFEQLQAQIKRLGLENHVRFELNRLDVEVLLAETDIFVLASREEGFGIAIIEAMAARCPVIVPKVGGAAEIVTHDFDGLHFETGNTADLVTQITRLANDPVLAEKLARHASETVGRYDICQTLASKCKLYRDLVQA